MSVRILHILILSAALGFSAGCASGSQEQRPASEGGKNESAMIVNEVDMPADEASFLEGTWQGKLEFSGVSLRIVFNVVRSTALPDTWQATMDSLDQGARGIPVSEVVFENGRVVFAVAVAGGGSAGWKLPPRAR